jgi:hypothetical protein
MDPAQQYAGRQIPYWFLQGKGKRLFPENGENEGKNSIKFRQNSQ